MGTRAVMLLLDSMKDEERMATEKAVDPRDQAQATFYRLMGMLQALRLEDRISEVTYEKLMKGIEELAFAAGFILSLE